MKLYQPVVRGVDCMEGFGVRYSKLVYHTEMEAEDAMDEFIEKCLTRLHDHDMGYLVNVTRSSIIELEVA